MNMAFIGAGSMAEAIIAGIIEKKICPAKNIYATNHRSQERLDQLQQRYGIQTTYELSALLQEADIIFVAVKPKDAQQACAKIKSYVKESAFVISVMAGISMDMISTYLPEDIAIARAMPNTSAQVGLSATALSFNNVVSEEQKKMATDIFNGIGITTIVKEEHLHGITGISGSGPAYIYYVVEAMEKAAKQLGLPEQTARQFIIQTIKGAAGMLESTEKTASQLRHEVTSPGGTTEAGLSILQQKNVDGAIIACIEAAEEQSKKMSLLFK